MDEQNPRKRKTPASPLVDYGDHLSSPTCKPDLPLPSPTSTLPLPPEYPPPAATPTDHRQLTSPSDAENDPIHPNTSLSSSTSEPPPLLPSSSTLPLLPQIPPPSSTPSDPKNEDDTIDPPYPWATNRRATVHTLDHLTKNGIKKIEGEVECKKCKNKYKRVFDLEEKFKIIADFMISPINNEDIGRERALQQWLTPDLGGCDRCGKKGRLNPVFPAINSGQEINWLFLFLGQMLEFCSMDDLKYFCKHNKVRRLGAEERLIYLACLGLCKQLDPTAAFDP